jgi:Ser/Thr protein kinase RdoA (MazF antagonist)
VTEQAVPSAPPVLEDALAAPFARLDDAALALVAGTGWGLDVNSVRRLDTERDDTVLVTHAAGRHVLKVAHPLDAQVVLDLQCAALRHAAQRDPGLPLPHLVPDRDGAVLRGVVGVDGEPRLARLLTYLEGTPVDYGRTTPAQRAAVGAAAGRLSAALADLVHPGADRVLAWDLQRTGTLRPLLRHVADPAARELVEAELDAYDHHVGAALRASRQQVVHHDVNADNVLVDPASDGFVTGILDFGDVVRSSIVGDLAVAMSYAVPVVPGSADDPWAAPYDIARGFRSVRDLTPDEVVLLPRLVRLRLAQRLLLNSWLASCDPANAHYTGRTIARSATALRRLVSRPSPVGTEGA